MNIRLTSDYKNTEMVLPFKKIVFRLYSSTCLVGTPLGPSESVPTWQVTPRQRGLCWGGGGAGGWWGGEGSGWGGAGGGGG